MKLAEVLLVNRDRVLEGHYSGTPVEVVEMRRLNSKTFDLGNGKLHLSHSLNTIHFFDEEHQQLRDVDLTIGKDGIKDAPYMAELLPGKVGYRYISRAGGWMQMELLTLDGESVEAPEPRIEDDRAFWDLGPVTIYFKAKPEHPEVYKLYDAPHTTEWRITSSPEFPGHFSARTTGEDANRDNLEILTSYEDGIFTETWTGRVSRRTSDKTRRKAWFSDPALPALVDAAISEQIADTADDGFSAFSSAVLITAGGTFKAGSAGDRIGVIGANSSWYNTGLRFRTLAIANGATILAASLTIYHVASYPKGGATVIHIWGDDVDDAALFANNNLPKDVTKTTAFKDFTPLNPNYSATPFYGAQAIDVVDVVAEILGRAGWALNNDLRVALLAQIDDVGRSRIYDKSNGVHPELAAQLDITYTVAAAATGQKNMLLLGVG